MRTILTSVITALTLLVLGATAAVAGPEPLPAEGRGGGRRPSTLLEGGTDWALVAGISTATVLIVAAAALIAMVTVKHRHNAAQA